MINDATLDTVAGAVRRYLAGWVEHGEDASEDLLRSLDDALRQATDHLEDDDRGRLATAFISLTRVGAELSRSPDDQVVTEAELLVRDAGMDQLRDDYESGARPWLWPPAPDTEWNALRVITALYMERRIDEWPQIALAEEPFMMYSPFSTALQGAQFFLQLWLQTESRTELLEHLDESHVAAWEAYLELPAKP